MTKFEFQELALDKFNRLKVGALFLKMGAGKTKIAVDLLNFNADRVDRLLWICPNQVKASSDKEIRKWRPAKSFRIYSYESISQSERIAHEALEFAKKHRCFLALDESIFVKNGETKRFLRIKAIRKLCPYCIIMNGTPVVKDEFDLYWQMNMLDERIIPYNEPDFRKLFFDEKIIKARGRRKAFTKYEFSQKNAAALAKLVAPYAYEVDIDYGLDVQVVRHRVQPTVATQQEYQELKQEALKHAGSLMAFMGELTKMANLASCDDNRIKKTQELASGKEPVIIYHWFRPEGWKLEKDLDCYHIDGSVKASERRSKMNLFELMRDKNLLMSLGTGSYGLNLQFCNHIIFNSYSWSYGQFEQAKARVVRIGQQRPVRIDIVEVDLPICKLIERCVSNKEDMSDFVKRQLLEDWSQLL